MDEQLYMSDMVEDRVKSEKVGRYDLFTSLLEASNESGAEALTDDELVGACSMKSYGQGI